MPHITGFTDNSNGTLAHYNLLQTIHDFAVDNDWQVMRYNTAIDNRELVLKSTGYSGLDEIYVLFFCYQNANNDYYNLAVGTALGYVPSNPINTQPNVIFSGIPAHNRRIDYWITLNPQRIAGALKVGTPVYESFYAGKFLPYARPNQYPLPLICAGMLNGTPAIRFSDTNHSMPYKGNRANLKVWFNDGSWKQPETYPFNNPTISASRDTNGQYCLTPIILNDNGNVYGCLEGIAHISGFDNVVENTITDADGTKWLVVQDVARTGANDYYALKLED